MHIVSNEPAEEACPALADAAAFRRFFEREGYIVVRNALPAALCAEAVDGFLNEVHLATRALFLRDAAGRCEPHVYTLGGHMQYPILNLQDLCGRRYPQFRAAGLALLTDPILARALETLLGAPARLLHSAYSDASNATPARRDANHDEGASPAAMIGAWIAAEDIAAGAGRCFVLPRSHLRPLPGERGHDPGGASCQVAPAMRQGDLLLWSAATIHGSLPATRALCARRAFSGHYIARADSSAGAMPGAIDIVHRSDPRSVAGRAANLLRADYPGAYTLLRRLANWRAWHLPGGAAAGRRSP